MDTSTSFASELSRKIFLDRYTVKDIDRQFRVGDLAIVLVEPHPKWPKKDIGIVKEILPNGTLKVELISGPQKGEVLERRMIECDRPLETTLEDVARRIANGVAQVEIEKVREDVIQSFSDELAHLRFVPGGRIWAGAGTGQQLTYFNCYVVPNPRDSREGIVETLGQMIEIMSRGGGVGINVSSLRPARASVRGVNGRSSGAVSWMDLYSRATGLVEQGGCFGPLERIATDKGLISASELAQRMDAGESFRALTHEGLRPITTRFSNGERQLYEVVTGRGFRVEVTKEHKMGVLRNGQITTVALENLSIGDEILTLLGDGIPTQPAWLQPLDCRSTRATRANEAVQLPARLTPELAYVWGYIQGSGTVPIGKTAPRQSAKAVKMATVDDHPEIRERLVSYCHRLFGVKPLIEANDSGYHTVVLDSRQVMAWLNQNGLLKAKPESVRVPEAIFGSGTDIMGAFASGYFDADDSDGAHAGDYGFDSVSLSMVRDVQLLLAVHGIASHISPPHRSEEGRRSYRLSVTGKEFQERLANFAYLSLKIEGQAGHLFHHDHYRIAPSALDIGDGDRNSLQARIPDRAPSRILERQGDAQETAQVVLLDQTLRVLPDTIASILPTRKAATYDFEVEGPHMLTGGGVYTSNSRRGALMLQIEDWHPDIWRFIDVKKTPGMVENANISVRVSDKFMDAVKADGDWSLVFPDTQDPDYDKLWDGNLEKWQQHGKPIVVYEVTKARKVWQEIIKGAWEAAEPGIVFDERHEKESNSWYFNPLVCTNPCITGDTLVYTSGGLVRAAELCQQGESLKVLVDGRFGDAPLAAASPVFRTGVKPVVRVKTEEGYSIRVTQDHLLYSEHRGWVKAGDLAPRESIRITNRGGAFGKTGTFEEGRALGWMVGNRPVTADDLGISSFPEPKQETWRPAIKDDVHHIIQAEWTRPHTPVALLEMSTDYARRREFSVEHDGDREQHRVPDSVLKGSESMQTGFLQALFEANARINPSVKNGTDVRLASPSLLLLEDVQRLLLNFGILSHLYENGYPAEIQSLSDSQPSWHHLVITGASTARFSSQIGFLSQPKQNLLINAVSTYRGELHAEEWIARVRSVTEDGIEPVYDLTEPRTHSFVANGLVVHNCAEQPLPAWGVCTLGHINLAAMYDPDQHDVNWDQLRRTIRMGVRFLDDIVDATPYFFQQNYDNQQNERRIGMGTLGLGELLIRLGLRYGSPESVSFIDHLYQFIACEAYLYDAELAREKGAFPAFDAEKYLQSGFMQRMPDQVRQAVRKNGTRNVTILTQAPTGTVGSMVGTSTGIEPFYALTYYRQSRLGFDEQYVPVAQEWVEQHPSETLPDYFVGAMDLTPEEHIYVQAAIQRWTDSSISKTANAPATYTIEDTARLYELAYDLGCKGVTIYRDQSRYEQVLHVKDTTLKADDTSDTGTEADSEHPTVARSEFPSSVEVYPVPSQVSGRTYRKETPAGTARVVINEVDSDPFEVFMLLGRAGSEIQSFMEALGRIISLYLRSSGDLTPRRRLQLAAEQLKGIGGANQMGLGPDRVLSVVDAIGLVLDRHLNPDKTNNVSASSAILASPTTAHPKLDLCPQCDAPTLVYEEGCAHCQACGFSRC